MQGVAPIPRQKTPGTHSVPAAASSPSRWRTAATRAREALAPGREAVGDRVFRWFTGAFAVGVALLLAFLIYQIAKAAWPSIDRFGLGFLTSTTWDVQGDRYGALPFIWGSVYTSLIALLLAVPVALGVAVFLTEYSRGAARTVLSTLVELLAGVPSIVYGLWGFFVLVPWLRTDVEPWMLENLGWVPIVSGPPIGASYFAAGLVLAIMILPTVTAISRDALLAVPRELREGAYALGATRSEVIRNTIIPTAKAGIVGAVILGLGRAMGETMAVTMVIGNNPQLATGLFEPGYTLPSILANNFGEASGTLYAALLELGLILLVITLAVNIFARLILNRSSAPRARPRRALTPGAILGRVGTGAPTTPAPREPAPATARGGKRFLTSPAARKRLDAVYASLCHVAAALAVIPLLLVLYYVASRGAPALTPDFLTGLPAPIGTPGGGILHAIQGTLLVVAIAAAVGIPTGILAGIYVAEFGRGAFADVLRNAAEVLAATPSILIGLFGYIVFVLETGDFSALAGGLTLSVMVIPVVMRTTELSLRTVPASLREGGIALGAPMWRTLLQVVVPSARGGIVTGSLLATARVAGETAPLLFTAFYAQYLSESLDEPVATLPTLIWEYSRQPFETNIQQAWGAALLLLLLVLVTNVAVRILLRNRATRS